MNYTKEQIQAILSKDNIPEDAKHLLEALILDKNNSIRNAQSSSAIPDLYKLKSTSTRTLTRDQDKRLEDIVAEVQEYLRSDYTKAFANIANSTQDRDVIRKLIDDYVLNKKLEIAGLKTAELVKAIADDILDFGQLNDLIYNRSEIEEIRINGSNDPVKIMVQGKQQDTDIILDPENVYLIAERMARSSRNAQPLRADKPFTRMRLGNNIRVTAMTDPIAREENNNSRAIQLIIRKQKQEPFSKDFLTQHTVNNYGFALIDAVIKYGISTIYYGGTNCGKTGTLRSFLDASIPNNRRGITIAEIDEMNLRKLDPITGKALNEILMWELSESHMSFREAVNAALTCSPELLVLQEMKGEECVEVMDGSITGHQMVVTMHADDVDVFPTRILQMYKQSGSDVQDSIILNLVPSAFPVIIQMQLLKDGTRRITSVDEIYGYNKEKDKLEYNNLLRYIIDDTVYKLDRNGNEIEVEKVIGHYEAGTFISNRLKEKMEKGGMSQKAFRDLEAIYLQEIPMVKMGEIESEERLCS